MTSALPANPGDGSKLRVLRNGHLGTLGNGLHIPPPDQGEVRWGSLASATDVSRETSVAISQRTVARSAVRAASTKVAAANSTAIVTEKRKPGIVPIAARLLTYKDSRSAAIP